MSPPDLLRAPAAAIQAELDTWETPWVELSVFGTDDAAAIAAAVEAFCVAELGAGIAGYRFYGSSVGSTHGVELRDGRAVVIKVRPPASTNPDLALDAPALEAICAASAWLIARGLPCPAPLLGPRPLGLGLATVEAMLDLGVRREGFDPAVRRAMAAGLAELIEALRGWPGPFDALRHFSLGEGPRLYPQPHSRLFDFEATAQGAAWIDAFAARARALPAAGGAPVVGHGDWKVEHLRFEGERIVAIYDMDSLALRSEAALVGCAAHAFTADWSREDVRRIPGEAELLGFIADYEEARGAPFSRAERREALGRCVHAIAYGARCTHALAPETREWPEDTWPHLLRAAGDKLLAQASQL